MGFRAGRHRLSMTRHICAFAIWAGVALSALGTGAGNAADASARKSGLWTDIGASERIDLSGRLHMLSQRIAAASCSLEAGVQENISKGIMAGSADEMDRIMRALKFGNPLMKVIGAEKDPRVLESISRVSESWSPIRVVLTQMHRDGADPQGLAQIERWNMPYFVDAKLLVSEIGAEYSNPADLLQRDAILVDLAGRQRMRSQKMFKQACELWLGKLPASELAATVKRFDFTLSALLYGAPEVGIAKAPTASLKEALQHVQVDWQSIKPVLDAVTGGADLSTSERTDLYLALNELLIKSNLIVTQYTKHAKNAY